MEINAKRAKPKKLVIVIPTLNELDNIQKLYQAVKTQTQKIDGWDTHLLFVDSHSTDGTLEVCRSLVRKDKKVAIIETGKGIGLALKTGFKHAFETRQAEVVLQMDADFSHAPSDIPRLMAEIERGYNLVIGSRFIKGGEVKLKAHRNFLSRTANFITRLLLGIFQVTEFTTSFRAFTKDLYQKIDWEKVNFTDNTFLPAFVYEAFRAQAKIKEIPIIFIDRQRGYSKIDIPRYIPHLLCYSLAKFSLRIKSFFFRKEVLLALVLIGLAAFFRFYHLSQTTWIAGDEGRDLLVMSQMLETKKPVLQGPPTSIVTDVGRVYYGPGFYYLVLPFFAISHGHPASGAFCVALMGVLSVLLIYFITKMFFGTWIGFGCAVFYATSPFVVELDRHFWSPNVVPFFILLIIFSFLQIKLKQKAWYLPVAGAATGIVWQLYYTSLFFLIPWAAWWLYAKVKVGLKIWIFSIGSFFFFSAPLLISELRHNFPNVRVLLYYLTEQFKPGLDLYTKLKTIGNSVLSLFSKSLNLSYLPLIAIVMLLGISLGLVFLIRAKSQSQERLLGLMVITWLPFSLLPHLTYSGEFAFDWRFIIFILPLPFLVVGLIIRTIWSFKIWGKLLTLAVFGFLVVGNLFSLDIRSPQTLFPFNQGPTLYNRQKIVDYIITSSQGVPLGIEIEGDVYFRNAYVYLLKYRGVDVSDEPKEVYRIIDPLRDEEQMMVKFGNIGVKKVSQ